MPPLRLTSCMAQNMDFIGRSLADYLRSKSGTAVEFLNPPDWAVREQLFDTGQVQLGWMCGAVYVEKTAQLDTPVVLLAAPVMIGARYQNRPIYFSDVVVHRESPFQTFADLHGASWAYNEPRSYSGYKLTCYTLAARGKTAEFFGHTIQTGSHQRSLQMVLNRQADASAIDSTVLETELRHHPALADQIRVIDTFGPNPMPPWVIRREVPAGVRDVLRQLLCQMHEDEAGREVLRRGGIGRFAPVQDVDYDPIRQVLWAVTGVGL